MDKKIHIMITGEEGSTRSLVFSKAALKKILGLSSTVILIFVALGITGIGLTSETIFLKSRVAGLEKSINKSDLVNNQLGSKVAVLEQEKEVLLKDAVDKLNERSRLIENILSAVGVDIEVEESQQNSGGPFASSPGESHEQESQEELIYRVEHYLDVVRNVPLGSPVTGVITSKFGRRDDPINQQKAYHEGVDIRGTQGTEVTATADGEVSEQGYSQGLGSYVTIDHKDGFRTLFGHLKKSFVKTGETVSRGKVIGLLGNSGRTTGPHVHYEIRYNGKLVDPVRFMRVASYLPAESASLIEKQYKSLHN